MLVILLEISDKMAEKWRAISKQMNELKEELGKNSGNKLYESVLKSANSAVKYTEKTAIDLERLESDSWTQTSPERLFGENNWKVAGVIFNNYQPKQQFVREEIIEKCSEMYRNDVNLALRKLADRGILERFGEGQDAIFRLSEPGYQMLKLQKSASEASKKRSET